MATPAVVYNDSDHQRLLYNDYYNLDTGSAERRVWVAPINPYVIQPASSDTSAFANSNNFSPAEVSGRIVAKFEPYFSQLKNTDPKALLMVYGPIKASLVEGLVRNGGAGGNIIGPNGNTLSNLMLSSSLSNYSELMAPTSYALTKFYENFVEFRNKMESLSNQLPNLIESMCCNGGGGGGSNVKAPYEPIINESEMQYDTVNEFLGRVNVLGPLVCSSGIHYRNYSFRFFLPDNSLVIPNSFVGFSQVDEQLPVTTITDQGYRAPVSGYYIFDVALRLKILQVTTLNNTALQLLLVRSVPGVTMFDPYQPPPGTNVIASYMSPYMGTNLGFPVEDTCIIQCKSWMNAGDVARVYAMGPTNRTIMSDSGNNNSLSVWTGALIAR